MKDIYYCHWLKWYLKYKNDIKTIAMLSPDYGQYDILRSIVEKDVKIKQLYFKDWNLYNKNKNNYDVIIASHVFMYSKDPKLWFANVLDSCKYLWINDSINRYLGDNGDQLNISDDNGNNNPDNMRFDYLPNYRSMFNNSYDISKYEISDIEIFDGSPENDREIHYGFICNMFGNIETNFDKTYKSLLETNDKYLLEKIYNRKETIDYFVKQKSFYNKSLNVFNYTRELDKIPKNVMIVAHFDDEILFGGEELIKNNDYLIVVCTNKYWAEKEFKKYMEELNIKNYIFYCNFCTYDVKCNFDYNFS
jgi:hypothetical protein